ncbi:MAG: hypothetical protein WD080_01560 [Egibacteraceae bacterium]
MVAVAWQHAPAGLDRPRPVPAGAPRAPRVQCHDEPGAGRRAPRTNGTHRALRRRRVAAGFAVAVVVGVVGMASGGAPTALRTDPAAGTAPPVTVVVQPGDTLWTVVADHVPPGADPMAYAVEVAAYNSLDPLAVPAGTVVRLPPVRP